MWVSSIRSHKLSDLVDRGTSNPAEDRERKKVKKNPQSLQKPATPRDTAKDSKLLKRCSGETKESSKEVVRSKDSSKHKKRSLKHTEQPHSGKVTVET